ncbi:hypothetical protein [Homoserinibacter sp. GY 40078]|uniref:hypothetical protein n=1 Tax=Homoserinibacter sp. GY 40078 TaxID=2603275 RepID=UPI0011CCA851|nr:hypothetical protein [Homoserinibacter sp. GY 40078]TXK19029.1 hypothetical protein FVQ89_03620 [Homoserinibacter sp. GY 40078]
MTSARRTALGLLVSGAIGVGAALVGLLPWLVTGARRPLQNLWGAETLPALMPITLLPFSQYAVTSLIALLVVGGVVSGIASRALRSRMPPGSAPATAAGYLLVQLVAIVQTSVVVGAGLQDRTESTVYLLACIAVAGFGLVVGFVAFVLIARAPVAGAVPALAAGALAFGSWVSALAIARDEWVLSSSALWDVVRWGPAVLVGAAIAWGGIRTAGRAIAAAVAILMLWIVPAVATAVSSSVGSRALLHYPLEMLDYGAGVFRSAVLMPQLVLPPVGVALVVAAIGIAVRELVARRPG